MAQLEPEESPTCAILRASFTRPTILESVARLYAGTGLSEGPRRRLFGLRRDTRGPKKFSALCAKKAFDSVSQKILTD